MRNSTIVSPRCILRKYIEADRPEFYRIFTDTTVMQFMGGGPCDSAEAASAIFDKIMDVYLLCDKHFEIWAITVEGRLAGHFELKQTDNTTNDELEIVYLLDKPYWGKRLMPEVITAVRSYAEPLKKQLIATINPENWNTIKALERSGIKKSDWVELDGEKVFKIWLPDAESTRQP